MDIVWLGHSSFLFRGKTVRLVTDPYSQQMVGLKYPKTEADIITISHDHGDHNAIDNIVGPGGGQPFVIRGPGEYEVKGVSVFGFRTFHDDQKGSLRGKNTVYIIDFEGVKICHLGDLGHKFEDGQLTTVGDVDILLIPVGGFYTIDADTAAEVVAQLDPKIVIPMHYFVQGMDTKGFSQVSGVEPFLNQMGVGTPSPSPKLTVTKDKLPETLQVVLLERKAS